jgi:putative tryptophan/tyrosine transport system substrate-binding protein
MRRRAFMTLLGGAAAVWPLAARAQQPAKIKRVAFFTVATPVGEVVASSNIYRPWFEELSRLGYVEGQNLVVERYSAEGRTEQFADLAREVVSTHPDVIYAGDVRLVLTLKVNSTAIPIVTMAPDPVAFGLVPSIAHPGGNITGISIDAGVEVWGKRLALLLEAIPKPSNAKFLTSEYGWESAQGSVIRNAAKQLGISITGALLDRNIDEAQYRRLFSSMEQDRVDALLVSPEAANFTYRQLIVDLAAKSRVPALYPTREQVQLGGLMAYAFNLPDTYRRIANVIGQILKGANPGDIPFYQQTKFELVINAKTAKALGLEIPPSLMLRADEVIE